MQVAAKAIRPTQTRTPESPLDRAPVEHLVDVITPNHIKDRWDAGAGQPMVNRVLNSAGHLGVDLREEAADLIRGQIFFGLSFTNALAGAVVDGIRPVRG